MRVVGLLGQREDVVGFPPIERENVQSCVGKDPRRADVQGVVALSVLGAMQEDDATTSVSRRGRRQGGRANCAVAQDYVKLHCRLHR